MGVDVKVALHFATSAFQAGVAKARQGIASLGKSAAAAGGIMRKAFSGIGGMGSLFGIGAISKLFSDAAKMAEDAFARMDFSKISKANAAAILAANNDFKSLYDTVVSGAARGFAAVSKFMRRAGGVAGAFISGSSWKEAKAIGEEEASGKQQEVIEEAIREAEFARYTKNTASGIDIQKKRSEERAKAYEKEAEALKDLEEAQQKGSDAMYEQARRDASSLKALALGPMADINVQMRDQRKLDRLVKSAERKMAGRQFSAVSGTWEFPRGQKLTKREELALAARDIEAGESMLKIEQYTKKTSEIIEQALKPGG